MTARPYSIRIFLPNGDPAGLRTIEKSNWSGSGLMVPRALLGEAKKRRELARTGVYLLIGPAEEAGLPRVYVGEGDPIRPRLDRHVVEKDFWTSIIAFTSKDENLNKAHVQYLEARLVAIARDGKRCLLDNGNVPQQPSLSEADAADAEGFLAELLLCLPLLGLNLQAGSVGSVRHGPTFFLKARGADASGSEESQGFVVRAGSRAAATEVPSCHAYLRQLRAALIANGVLRQEAEHLAFVQDYAFASPSTAAGVVLGRSANGRIEWKTKNGGTLKAVQTEETAP